MKIERSNIIGILIVAAGVFLFTVPGFPWLIAGVMVLIGVGMQW